jgi:hypothetical protein
MLNAEFGMRIAEFSLIPNSAFRTPQSQLEVMDALYLMVSKSGEGGSQSRRR